MTQLHSQQHFQEAYAGDAPWDIPAPQASFVAAADKVASPVLDCGCGTGENALYFAARGHQVTGVDFLAEAITRAQAKAAERKLPVQFRVQDALTLGESAERFATVLDSGLFHVFSDEDRRKYVAGLAHVLQPGGRLLLMCFSDQEPGVHGPRRISHDDLVAAFAEGWVIESLERVHFGINPKFVGATFSEGGPKSWFVVIRRV